MTLKENAALDRLDTPTLDPVSRQFERVKLLDKAFRYQRAAWRLHDFAHDKYIETGRLFGSGQARCRGRSAALRNYAAELYRQAAAI